MTPDQIDKDRVLKAILASKVPPAAAEEASRLVEAWIEEWVEHDSTNWRILAVEMPFFLWLDPEHTALAIGVSDLRAQLIQPPQQEPAPPAPIFHGEWKSAAPPKARSRYSEESWKTELLAAPQIAIYSLAQREGTFLIQDSRETSLYTPNQRTPIQMFVRACVKSTPPSFWPSNGAYFAASFQDEELDIIKQTLLGEARAMQARRQIGTPWMLPGHQCTNMFGRQCAFLEKCKEHKYPEYEQERKFSSSDPGSAILKFINPDELANPELIVLSSSAYSDAQQCAELYRQRNLCAQPKEESFALDVGTGMHAGVGETYKIIKEDQDARNLRS